eukprot:15650889-Heterocapsa_arctica.AAC.1
MSSRHAATPRERKNLALRFATARPTASEDSSSPSTRSRRALATSSLQAGGGRPCRAAVTSASRRRWKAG